MKRVFSKLIVVILVIFAMSITGCLSQKQEAPKAKPVDQKTPTTPITTTPTTPETQTGETKLPVYVPSDKERPQLVSFKAPNIDSPIVQKGQVVKFAAEALVSKYPLTIEYSATGGKIDSNGNWTAPDKAGFYQIMAYAVDGTNNVKSDPMIIEMRVAKSGTTGIMLSSAPSIVKDGKTVNGPKRAISFDDADTASSVSKYILNTSVAGSTGNTATIQLTFSDTTDNHVIAPSLAYGTLTFTGETKVGAVYTASYTYKAPATVPVGGRANVEFNIYNPSDINDSDTATVSFIINVQPTIATIAFTTGSQEVIGLAATKTIKVTASDTDQTLYGDKLTFTYTLLSGSGSLSTGNGGTNITGEVDYTAPSTAGTALLLVLVQDTRGTSVQKTLTIFIQNPMSMMIADSGIIGADPDGEAEKYAEATGDNAAKYRLLTKTSGTAQAQWMTGNNSNLNTAMGAEAKYYFKDTSVLRAAQTVTWSVYNEITTATAISGINNRYFTIDGLVTDTQDVDGYNYYPNTNLANYLGRGGLKTIKATTVVTDPVSGAVETLNSTDTVRVNEIPYITGITMTDSLGNTSSMFNGTAVSIVQVPVGRKFTVAVNTFDADNDRIAPVVADYPFNTAGFMEPTLSVGEADNGLVVSGDLTVAPLITAPSWASAVNDANITVNAAPDLFVAKTVYSNAMPVITVNVGETAAIDPVDTYHYLYLHVTDGYGQAVDAALGGSTVDFYRVGYEMSVSNPALPAPPLARTIDIGTVAGMTSYNKNLVLEFVSINGVMNAKIKDLDTNTYWTKTNGDPVLIVPSTLNANAADGILNDDGIVKGTDYAALDTVANESLDWLAIAIGSAANWVEGDKVYFKTYANTVMLKYQVVQGGRITGVTAPQYVTLGETGEIKVSGAVDAGKTASVVITETSSSGGQLDAGIDTDGDEITNEVWTYKAPSTWPVSKTVALKITITDSDGNKTVLPYSIELNRKPVVTGVKDTTGLSVMSGDYWILSGGNNLQLIANATDPDGLSDVLKYDWGLSSSWGTLSNITQATTYWTPMIGIVPIDGNDGPLADGKIPFSVAARDFDKNGQPKGGYSGLKTFSVGINDAPVVGAIGYAAGNAESELNGVDFTLGDAAGAGSKYINSTVNVGIIGDTVTDLNDSLVDKNNLRFQWYVTDDATGKIAQNIGTFYTTTTTVNSLPAQRYWWMPNKDVRKASGDYTLHVRVSDQKTGAAKGITEQTFALSMTGDNTAPISLPVATAKLDVGTAAVYGIGDIVRISVPLNGGAFSHDIEQAQIDLGALMDTTAVAPAPTLIADAVKQMIYSDAGTPDNYTDDYLYYDYVVTKATTIGQEIDAATPIASVLATDTSGNVEAAWADTLGIVVDNYVDVEPLAVTPSKKAITEVNNVIWNANANTGLLLNIPGPDNATWLHIGDEISFIADTIGATDDLTASYAVAGTELKVDGTYLGLGNAIASDTYGAGFTLPALALLLAESKTMTYVAADFALTTFNKIPMTVTDDAGNVAKGNIIGDGLLQIDLKRPVAKSVKLYSYAPTALTEKDGTTAVVPAAAGPDVGLVAGMAGAMLADDLDTTTMELVAIEFDEAMLPETLNDYSINVNLVTVPKVSLSKGAAQFTKGAATVGTFTAAQNYYYHSATNTLYIAMLDVGADTTRSLARDSIVEVLFTDSTAALSAVVLSNPNEAPYTVVADAHANEIDYTKDYSDGNLAGYLQW